MLYTEFTKTKTVIHFNSNRVRCSAISSTKPSTLCWMAMVDVDDSNLQEDS